MEHQLSSRSDELALAFGAIASEAGQIILSVRRRGFQTKADGSPVTDADLESDKYITARLSSVLPNVPIISEESVGQIGSRSDVGGLRHFILVDPLDGTREFVAGRDEFTVNIALIEAKQPVVGAIYAPAKAKLYVASENAYGADVQPGRMPGLSAMQQLRTSSVPAGGLRAVASRSHMDPATRQWLDNRQIAKRVEAGSSLKFCAIAEGAADVYPRCGPTMEWDTAAGHAILVAAGGLVVGFDGAPFEYGKTGAGFRNAGFVAWGQAPNR
jgi:3'(2'), 5'-bisphosphate nucleotidase